MSLGTLLATIAENQGITREQLKAEFLEKVKDHQEEKLLMECLRAACHGDKSIRWREKILPPETLMTEGFYLVSDRTGYRYHFE